MNTRAAFAKLVMVLCTALAGCASTGPAGPPAEPFADRLAIANESAPPPSPFEQQQRERALSSALQKRLADAALAWEILAVLRPDVGEYRQRLVDTQRQIDAAVTERLPRAAQAARRGENDRAAQQYLAVLALQPQNQEAADALRALERERNKRNFLGKYSRVTITRRAIADAEMPVGAGLVAGANDVEHAALLAGDDEFDDAIALLERRLAAEWRDPAARRLLANVYYRQAESLLRSDKAAAVAALERSVRLDPAVPRAVARLRQLKGGAAAPAAAAASGALPARAAARPAR